MLVLSGTVCAWLFLAAAGLFLSLRKHAQSGDGPVEWVAMLPATGSVWCSVQIATGSSSAIAEFTVAGAAFAAFISGVLVVTGGDLDLFADATQDDRWSSWDAAEQQNQIRTTRRRQYVAVGLGLLGTAVVAALEGALSSSWQSPFTTLSSPEQRPG